MFEWILTIILGFIIGALGRLVIPGKQPLPWWMTILVGVVAIVLGKFIFQGGMGVDGFGLFILQVLLAAGIVFVANRFINIK